MSRVGRRRRPLPPCALRAAHAVRDYRAVRERVPTRCMASLPYGHACAPRCGFALCCPQTPGVHSRYQARCHIEYGRVPNGYHCCVACRGRASAGTVTTPPRDPRCIVRAAPAMEMVAGRRARVASRGGEVCPLCARTRPGRNSRCPFCKSWPQAALCGLRRVRASVRSRSTALSIPIYTDGLLDRFVR